MAEGTRVVIIGGGPGGYVAAIRAAQLGGRVTMIEKDAMGGTCLNRGCVPTKFLIHATNILWQARHAKAYGLGFEGISVDLAQMMKQKGAVVARLRSGVEYLMGKNKIEIVRGVGSIAGRGKVSVSGAQQKTIEADKIIIATGSEPSSIPVDGAYTKAVITSDDLLAATAYPKSILVIGGGVVGVEFAQVLSRLGVKVTIVEMMPRILPSEDAEISGVLQEALKKESIAMFMGARVNAIKTDGAGMTTVFFESDGGKKEASAEKVLMAVGRRPYLKDSGIDKIGILPEKGGRLVVNDCMETKVGGVYAIGDVLGGSMLAHVAMAEGICAAENALGMKKKMDYSVVPRCVYSSPEVAGVGLTEAEVKAKYGSVKVGKFPLVGNSKGVITDETSGMVKMVADPKYKQVLGVQIAAPHATELIAEAGLAIRLEATMEEIATTIHAHPTLSEAMAEAGLNGEGKGLHF